MTRKKDSLDIKDRSSDAVSAFLEAAWERESKGEVVRPPYPDKDTPMRKRAPKGKYTTKKPTGGKRA